MKTFEQYMYRKRGGCLMDCPERKLAVGKHKGEYLSFTPISYQEWAKSKGYPEWLFEPRDKKPDDSEQDEAGGYCDEVCNTNYYGGNNI